MNNLENYSIDNLKNICKELEIPIKKTKKDIIEEIKKVFQEYEEYKKDKIDKYIRLEQLGNKGKEGTTYLVKDKKGKEYAMKTFRKSKSSNTLLKEYEFQKKASERGISPKVYDYDTISKYILMEKMDEHLTNLIVKQKGVLKKHQQERIIQIFSTLDEIGVFHNDSNLANYMVKDGVIYIIDFGFAKEITPVLKKKAGSYPNMRVMLLAFVIKLKENHVPLSSCRYLLKKISSEDRESFKLNE